MAENWDKTTPLDTDPINQGAGVIRAAKAALEAALAKGGVFPGPNPTTDPEFYPVIEKDAEASRPAASADYAGRMFINTTKGGGTLQRIKDDGSAWEDVVVNPAASAVHAAAAETIASAAGVLTLTENGNSVYCTGTEAITSIAGWSAGVVVVRWASGRVITHGASLLLRNAQSRHVVAGDVSVFEFFGADQCREISFYGAGAGCDVGDVKMVASETVPAGFLECNGASLLRADYPVLFAVIGVVHGTADGTHFNLPDLRGKFPRGWDHGAGNDPDAAARTAATGGASADHVGSLQDHAIESHDHTIPYNILSGQDTNAGGPNYNSGSDASPVNVGDTGGNETRPVNVAMMYVIKY